VTGAVALSFCIFAWRRLNATYDPNLEGGREGGKKGRREEETDRQIDR
jgi:hypothetical protein